VLSGVSQPSDIGSQSPKPVAQDMTAQVPPLHLPVAFAGAQARPHMPQLLSVSSRTSQPFEAIPSQSASIGLQVATAHAPPMHAAVAPGTLQDLAHIPQ